MFINFFPGDTRDERSLSIDADAGYAVEDLEDFVKSVIVGCTSSCYIAADGEDGDLASHIAALKDGALLGDWFGRDEHPANQSAVEEVHAELTRYRDQRGMTITLSTQRDYLGAWADDADYDEFEAKAAAILKREWPYATHRTAQQSRLITVDHDEARLQERVEAEAVQLLEKVW